MQVGAYFILLLPALKIIEGLITLDVPHTSWLFDSKMLMTRTVRERTENAHTDS